MKLLHLKPLYISDDDDDDDVLFCGVVGRRKAFNIISKPGPLSETLTIANLQHTARRI